MIIGSGVTIGSNITIGDLPVVIYTPQTSLYSFTTFTFRTGNIVGNSGPSATQLFANSYTSNVGNTWITSSSYFSVVNGYQYWTVPSDGSYQITAAGSRSGISSFTGNTYAATRYGRGATISGTFSLNQGQVIAIVVGQPSANAAMGATYSSPGGGGGTFVVLGNTFPLVVAGGGGSNGTWTSNLTITFGGNGTTTTSGGNSYNSAPGGTNGLGGNSHVSLAGTISPNTYDGGGGGGFYGNGVAGAGGNSRVITAGASSGGGGAGFFFGANGGQYAGYPGTTYSGGESFGGFGGGGGPGPICGGGGGGYSGGAGTYTLTATQIDSAGGGGSWVAANATAIATHTGTFNGSSTFNGLTVTTVGSLNEGPGYVTITKVA